MVLKVAAAAKLDVNFGKYMTGVIIICIFQVLGLQFLELDKLHGLKVSEKEKNGNRADFLGRNVTGFHFPKCKL